MVAALRNPLFLRGPFLTACSPVVLPSSTIDSAEIENEEGFEADFPVGKSRSPEIEPELPDSWFVNPTTWYASRLWASPHDDPLTLFSISPQAHQPQGEPFDSHFNLRSAALGLAPVTHDLQGHSFVSFRIQDQDGIHLAPAGRMFKVVRDNPQVSVFLSRNNGPFERFKPESIMDIPCLEIEHNELLKWMAEGPGAEAVLLEIEAANCAKGANHQYSRLISRFPVVSRESLIQQSYQLMEALDTEVLKGLYDPNTNVMILGALEGYHEDLAHQAGLSRKVRDGQIGKLGIGRRVSGIRIFWTTGSFDGNNMKAIAQLRDRFGADLFDKDPLKDLF